MREKTYIDELLGRGSSKQTEPQIQGDKGRKPPIISWKGPLRTRILGLVVDFVRLETIARNPNSKSHFFHP
jgi:hypothetical protein